MPTPPALQPGTCPICGKEYKNLPPHVNAHRRRGEGAPDLAVGDRAPGPSEGSVAGLFDEPAPVETKKGWREKLWGSAPKDVPPSKEPKPQNPERRPRRRREPADQVLGGAWGLAGIALERSGADVPVGRVMQFQQPIAGPILDDLVADTFIDRKVLQRFGGKAERWEQTAALLTLPVCVAVCERNPDMAVALQPLALAAIRKNLPQIVGAMRKAQEDDAKYREAVADMGMPAGDDPAVAIWEALFTPPPEPQAEPAPSTNGAGAGATATAAATHGTS